MYAEKQTDNNSILSQQTNTNNRLYQRLIGVKQTCEKSPFFICRSISNRTPLSITDISGYLPHHIHNGLWKIFCKWQCTACDINPLLHVCNSAKIITLHIIIYYKLVDMITKPMEYGKFYIATLYAIWLILNTRRNYITYYTDNEVSSFRDIKQNG